MIPDIRCAVQGADILGEVPLWCDRTELLWWVDVRRPALQCYDPVTGAHRAIRLPDGLLTGSIALREAGGFLLATQRGFFVYDPDAAEPPRFISHPEADLPQNRLNDGKCDRRGRFWVGSMRDAQREPEGTLYRFDPDYQATPMATRIVVPNSVAWSPDDKTMYFADTHIQIIWAFDFDIDEGRVTNRRVFKDWTHQVGRPDGSTVDAEGYLWTAMVASGELVRLAPDGSVDRVIRMPVTNPTCPAFGGADLGTLFVTSHSQRLTPEQLATEPAGALLMLDVGVKGIKEPRFRG